MQTYKDKIYTKTGINKNTEWIFAFSPIAQAEIPILIRFETNKSFEEIKDKYSNNGYDDETGLAFLSIWYCDEYTNFYDYVGRKVANGDINWRLFNPDDEDLQIIKTELIPTVNLDEVFSKNPVNKTGDYYNVHWY